MRSWRESVGAVAVLLSSTQNSWCGISTFLATSAEPSMGGRAAVGKWVQLSQTCTRCDLTKRHWHCPLPALGGCRMGLGALAPRPHLLCLLSFLLGITNDTSSVPGAGLKGHGSYLPEDNQERNHGLTFFPFFPFFLFFSFFSSIPSLLISLGF